MIDENDWRLRGQEEYMKGLKFRFSSFLSENEHAHCEFCWHKFMKNPGEMEDCSSEGYCFGDNCFWVCKECFHDFKELFQWETLDDKQLKQPNDCIG